MKILNAENLHLTGSDRRHLIRLVRNKARWLRCDRRFITASFRYSNIDGSEWVGCFSAHRHHFGPGRGQWVVLTNECAPDDSRLVRL